MNYLTIAFACPKDLLYCLNLLLYSMNRLTIAFACPKDLLAVVIGLGCF